MRRSAIYALAAALLALSTAAMAETIHVSAFVDRISGDVRVQRFGDAGWNAAEKGMEIHTGDKVRTGAGAETLLRWGNGNMLELKELSMISVEQLERDAASGELNSTLSLTEGELYARAAKLSGPGASFTVKTPTAVAGVRGTRFKISLTPDGKTVIETLDGEVVFSSADAAGQVVVGTGQTSTAQPGQTPPQPTPLTQEQLSAWIKEATDLLQPALLLFTPPGDMNVVEKTLLVSGITDPGSSVTVQGAAAEVSESGYFETQAALADGENNIEVVSTSHGGQSVSATRKITVGAGLAAQKNPIAGQASAGSPPGLDAAAAAKDKSAGPLQVQILAPSDGYLTRQKNITVAGVAPGADWAAVNDQPATFKGATFAADATLEEGENTLRAIATSGDKSAEASIKITLDTKPPMLLVVQPTATFNVFEGSGACQYISNDAIECLVMGLTEADAALTINDEFVAVEADGSFAYAVVLGGMDTSITVAAEDTLGNRSSQTLQREAAALEPVLISLTANPASLKSDGQSSATVTATVTNFFGKPVEGVVVTFDSSDSASGSGTDATDASGQATVTYDAGFGLQSTKIVTITATVHGALTASASITVTPDVPPDPATEAK